MLNTYSVEPHIPTLAHWADWQLTRYGFTGNRKKQPRLVFVRGRPDQLKVFFDVFLPRIHADTRFVLITGDVDHTMPRQLDLRYEDFVAAGLAESLESLRKDPRLIHWYAQNLDTHLPKMTPIPLGYIERDGGRFYRKTVAERRGVDLRNRPLRAICAHRVRQGPQWQKRRDVSEMADRCWSAFVDHRESIPSDRYATTIARYPFVICVSGGGLDPAPKAWAALLAGSIPIVERNATTDAYRELPVAFVDAWTEDCLDIDRLKKWVDELHPFFEDATLRQSVLARMSMATWLGRIERRLDGIADGDADRP